MKSTIGWHVAALALSCIVWPVGLIVHGITLFQLRRVPRGYRGRAMAIVFTIVYLALGGIWLVYTVISAVRSALAAAVTPTTF